MLIKISRRQLITGASALGAMPALAQLPSTPLQTIGPFYPADRPGDGDADLTVTKGRPGRAKGQILYVTGRVTNPKGEPVPGARIEIWQCNAAGKYAHGADTTTAPLDPNFTGFGIVTADKDGRYRFKTIKPGAYPVSKTAWRPPHIHVDIAGKQSRIISQIYFPGEPLNEKDSIFKETRRIELLIAKIVPPEKNMEPDAKIALWDVVLNQG
jgi:protocatechuate 3,4-dioxygenase, beta subunit